MSMYTCFVPVGVGLCKTDLGFTLDGRVYNCVSDKQSYLGLITPPQSIGVMIILGTS